LLLLFSAIGFFRITTSHRISSFWSRVSLQTTSTSNVPGGPSLTVERLLVEPSPTSPSSDSVPDASIDELLTALPRDEEGVIGAAVARILCGDPFAARPDGRRLRR
jgi:hypothetical protein